jgi:hypothetical protein
MAPRRDLRSARDRGPACWRWRRRHLIDRVRIGHVIDFVDMGIGGSRWYAWNIADAAVFLGILALFAAALLGDRAIPGRSRSARGA